MLGRVVRTAFIMRYFHEAKLHDRIQLQLIEVEGRHALTKRLFFGNNGVFRTGEADELMNKVSALSVLSNAVLVWNTKRMRVNPQVEFSFAMRSTSATMSSLRRGPLPRRPALLSYLAATRRRYRRSKVSDVTSVSSFLSAARRRTYQQCGREDRRALASPRRATPTSTRP